MIISVFHIILALSILSTAIFWLVSDSRVFRQLCLTINQILFFIYLCQNTNQIVAALFLFIGILIILLPLWLFPQKRIQKPEHSQKLTIILKIMAVAVFLILSLIALIFPACLNHSTEPTLPLRHVYPIEILWIIFIMIALFFIQLYQMVKDILDTND